MFPMFVFLSLYMQQVLGYSAIRAGLAFLVIAVGIIVSSGLAQGLVTRAGAKVVLTAGPLGFAAAQALFLRLPAAGSYAAHLLPGFIIVAPASAGPPQRLGRLFAYRVPSSRGPAGRNQIADR